MSGKSLPRSWRAKNERRVFLINKELDNGLSSEEAEELARLQEEVGEYVDRRFPLPLDHIRAVLDEARQIVQEEKARAEEESAKDGAAIV